MEKIFAGLLSLLGFNLNPMSKVQDQIDLFKKNNPQSIKTYEGQDRQMGYASAGNPTSRAVLFVHGSPGTKDSWYAFLSKPDLVARFHLLAVDRPGYGASGTESERSLEKQARNIWEVLKLNQSDKSPILVGHSFGGPVIAKIAALYPDRVGALVFVASSVDPALEETKFIQRVGNLWGIRSLIPKPLRVCNEEILALKGELTILGPEWKNIRARVAVIHGDQDDLVPVKNADFIVSKVKVDDLQILKGVNHFIPWLNPSVIEQAILKLDAR